MENLPAWSITVGSGIVGIIGIGWSGITAYQKGFGKFEIEKDQAAKDLVKILQATVDALKKQVDELGKSHIENMREISHLSGENATLMKILQGRDEMAIKFQSEGFAAFARIAKMADGFEHLAQVLEGKLK